MCGAGRVYSASGRILKIALAGFGNCKNVTVAECCDYTVAGIAPLGQANNNHDPARLVIALHKKAPVTVCRPPGLSIQAIPCHGILRDFCFRCRDNRRRRNCPDCCCWVRML
jgi:hypothetical protein